MAGKSPPRSLEAAAGAAAGVTFFKRALPLVDMSVEVRNGEEGEEGARQ